MWHRKRSLHIYGFMLKKREKKRTDVVSGSRHRISLAGHGMAEEPVGSQECYSREPPSEPPLIQAPPSVPSGVLLAWEDGSLTHPWPFAELTKPQDCCGLSSSPLPLVKAEQKGLPSKYRASKRIWPSALYGTSPAQ